MICDRSTSPLAGALRIYLIEILILMNVLQEKNTNITKF